MVIYRGGMSSIGYKLAQPNLINGFGTKKYRGRGNDPAEDPETKEEEPKRSRGRPKKAITENTAPIANQEEYYSYTPLYGDKIANLLESALSHSKMAQYHLKKSQIEPLIAREELRRFKKLEKLLTTMLFTLSE